MNLRNEKLIPSGSDSTDSIEIEAIPLAACIPPEVRIDIAPIESDEITLEHAVVSSTSQAFALLHGNIDSSDHSETKTISREKFDEIMDLTGVKSTDVDTITPADIEEAIRIANEIKTDRHFWNFFRTCCTFNSRWDVCYAVSFISMLASIAFFYIALINIMPNRDEEILECPGINDINERFCKSLNQPGPALWLNQTACSLTTYENYCKTQGQLGILYLVGGGFGAGALCYLRRIAELIRDICKNCSISSDNTKAVRQMREVAVQINRPIARRWTFFTNAQRVADCKNALENSVGQYWIEQQETKKRIIRDFFHEINDFTTSLIDIVIDYLGTYETITSGFFQQLHSTFFKDYAYPLGEGYPASRPSDIVLAFLNMPHSKENDRNYSTDIIRGFLEAPNHDVVAEEHGRRNVSL